MATTVPITNSNGTVWSFASTDTPANTALAVRMHDLAFLTEGSSSAFGMARPGVLPSAGQGATAAIPGGLVVSPTGSGLGVQVSPGAGPIERGTFSGAAWSTFTPAGTDPYTVALKSAVTFNVDAANSLSGTRIDRIDLALADGPGYGDNSGVSFGQIIYIAGTVSSGTAATSPSNSIPLARITLPAGTTTTLTSGMITDMRRSAGIGGDRILLPGDALTDPGFMAAETRWRYSSSYAKWLMDVWDPVASAWKGTETLALPAGAWQNGSSNISILATARTNLVVVSVPDPGWPYTLQVSAQIDWNGYGTWSPGVTPPFVQLFTTIDTNAGTIIGQSNGFTNDPTNNFDAWTTLPMTAPTATLTGAHSVVLSGKGKVLVNCPFSGFSALATYLNVLVNPV